MADVPFELAGIEPLRLIGNGGFGEVWLARQSNIDRQVAVKVGHTPIDDQTVQLRFERECIALGRLSGHPNIMDVFTAGQLEDGRPYLVLEYISGGTLWQRMQKSPLSQEEVRTLGVQLADALRVAHAAGVLHRDLKPENVLLRPGGEAVLGDFGIARLHDSDNTTTHAITASVAYAAPEILSGKSASAAADLYGIGICLLSSWLRRVPFVEPTDESIHPIINRVLSEDAPDLTQQGMSESLYSVIKSLLAKDPTDRPKSAEDLQHQLLDVSLELDEPLAPTDRTASDLLGRGGGGATWTPPTRPAQGDRWPASMTSTSLEEEGTKGWDRIRLLGAGFGALLLLGGLLVFALAALDDDSDETDPGPTTETSFESSSTSSTQTSTDEVTRDRPLVLPLSVDDTELGPGTTETIDDNGPSSSGFCEETPTTEGLVEWEGSTLSATSRFPIIFQQLSRFETPDDASAYVSAYLDTALCDEWTIPAEGNTPEIVLLPSVVTPSTIHGDESAEVVFSGSSSFLSLFGRTVIIRRQNDVYILSITGLAERDLEDLTPLVELAVSRLEL
ncbi:MAG: serine/threonine protein kinase [Actinomycetia bacterium]|nr:serine/threonine protein kinase [Actinomycetes bacterium]MCP5035360.1 serine/threonine protein kinase [Actinomycetes bacterium]